MLVFDPESVPPTRKRSLDSTSTVATPWYRDLRFSIGLFAAPFFFFAHQIVALVASGLSPEQMTRAEDAVTFISGAVLLFPLAALIERVTDYYEHNFHHHHDRNSALLRAGLLHTTFTNFAFLALTLFTLINATASGTEHSNDLIRIVQVSIAGSIVVSILFNLGVAIFIGGLNFKRHGGRMNFSKELANQDAEMLTIAVVILSLPTLASHFNINPSFLDNTTYKLTTSGVQTLSVIVSVVMIFIYVSYFLWTLLKVGDPQGATMMSSRHCFGLSTKCSSRKARSRSMTLCARPASIIPTRRAGNMTCKRSSNRWTNWMPR